MLTKHEVQQMLDDARISKKSFVKKRNSHGVDRVSTSVQGMIDYCSKMISVCDTALELLGEQEPQDVTELKDTILADAIDKHTVRKYRQLFNK